MSTYHLTIATPERIVYDSEAQNLIVRTTSGEIGILRGHSPYVAPLAIGRLKVTDGDGKVLVAALSGGMIKVDPDEVTLLADTCEWAEEIDVERAERARDRAQHYIENPTELHTVEVADAKLRRAMNRIDIGTGK